MNWERLQPIYEMAKKAQVNFSLVWEEAVDLWRVEITSAAPSEEYFTASMTFEGALNSAAGHLASLLPPAVAGDYQPGAIR